MVGVPSHSAKSVLIFEVDDYQRVPVCRGIVGTVTDLLDAWYILEEMVHLAQHLIDDFTPHIWPDSQDHLMLDHVWSPLPLLKKLASSTDFIAI
jgi:hypothetical protein